MNLNSIEIIGVKQYKNISEYNFYLLKIRGILSNNIKIDFYLKFIEKGEVKQSVYCYYSLLYEELKKNDEKSRVRIIEKESTLIKNTVIISFDEEKQENNIEVNLFNLEKFKKYNTDKKIDNYINEIESKDILLIGVKYIE